MLTYSQLSTGLLAESDNTAMLALQLDRIAQQITESPADYAKFLQDAAGDDAQCDPGAAVLLHRTIRANSLLLEALKNLRVAIVRAQAAAKAEGRP